MRTSGISRLVPRASFAAALLAALAGAQGTSSPYPGLTLFAPNTAFATYLIDLSGNVVHSWPGAFAPGKAVYLAPNGTLLRSIDTQSAIWPDTGGSGGGLQEVAFDGTILWDYLYDTPTERSHHDFELLPNGNYLIIAWDTRSQADAIAVGRDPAITSFQSMYPDHIIEVKKTGPTTGQIVWAWYVWDHLVQDFDPTKPNYDVVANRPERIDVNYPYTDPLASDWTHINSVDYHEDLDQILLSVHSFHEMWIVDKSTTTAEAAGSTGGRSGKGGDLLYRWGNPAAYGAGTTADQQFFGQHTPRWVEKGFPGEGNITVFNNGIGRPAGPYSSIDEIVPPQADATGNYPLTPGSAYGPAAPVWTYTAPVPTDFYSAFISSADRLANGNTLICEGLPGHLFEVDPAGNTVWEYYNNFGSGSLGVFRTSRYGAYLFPSSETMSVSAGGSVVHNLVAGTTHAGQPYLLLASFSGTAPGTPLPGGLATVPLNADSLTNLIVQNVNSPAFSNYFGVLDGTGNATATLTLAPGLDPALIGLTADFAYLTLAPYDFASNPMPLTFVP
jgi:hypothetical protein